MQTLKTSVAIVGSWGAWLRCAIELFENGFKDVLIVGDRPFDDPHTTQARWWINAALHTMDKEDNTLIHAVDTYREGEFLAHPHLVEMLADEGPAAIDDLVRRWANFHREEDGRLTQRFFGAHSYRRTCFCGDQTGKEMILTLCKRATELGIPFLWDMYVYKLLTTNNKVNGILADKDGETIHIQAPIVVFATGGYSNVFRRSSSRQKESFGDGIGVAFAAGAAIGDIEMVQFHPTWLLFPPEKFGELVTEAVRWEWGRLFNANGERFMEKYDPVKLELAARDVVARANFQEIREGRWTPHGWVYLDITHRSKEYIMDRLPKMYSMILEFDNIDISKQPVEVAPTTHYTMGGIRFDPYTFKTTLDGFYVAGECTMSVHGANRLWGNSLLETMVFGKHIGQAVLAADKVMPNESISEKDIAMDYIRVGWINAQQTLEQVRKDVRHYAWIVRVESELLELEQNLKNIRALISEKWIAPGATKHETVVMAHRLLTVLQIAELITQWALARKESRGAHFRTDYPKTSDEFKKTYLHQLVNGEITNYRRELPAPSERLAQGLITYERTQNFGHVE